VRVVEVREGREQESKEEEDYAAAGVAPSLYCVRGLFVYTALWATYDELASNSYEWEVSFKQR
jgi:hypothetical protein